MKTRTLETGSSEKKSFTLVELLVVLAVIAIVAGVVIPRIAGSLESRQLREATASLAHMARTTRALAMAQQRTYTMKIDVNRGGWSIRQENGGKEKKGPARMSWLKNGRLPKGVRVVKFSTPESIEGKEGEIMFGPDGTSSGAMIELGCESRTMSLVVHPHNGRVVCGENREQMMAADQYDLGE
jgi:type II secretion system protein H